MSPVFSVPLCLCSDGQTVTSDEDLLASALALSANPCRGCPEQSLPLGASQVFADFQCHCGIYPFRFVAGLNDTPQAMDWILTAGINWNKGAFSEDQC